MTKFVCYSLENGLLDHIRETTAENLPNLRKPENHEFFEVSEEQSPDVTNSEDWYVELSTMTLTARPSFDVPEDLELAVGETRTFTVPQGTRADFDGDVQVIDDGSLEISADVAESYTIELSFGIYKPLSVEVTVNESSS